MVQFLKYHLDTIRLEKADIALQTYNFRGSFAQDVNFWNKNKDVWSKSVFVADEDDKVKAYNFSVTFKAKTPFVKKIVCKPVS